MKIALPLVPLALVLACAPHTASARSLLGPDLQIETVFSNTYTSTGANSTVYGNVLAGGVSTIGASGFVAGNLVSGGAANLGGLGTSGRDAKVAGSILSGGVSTTGDHAEVGANITSSGASTVGANSKTGGNITSDGASTTGASSTVMGNIQTGGAASIGATAHVTGDVAAVGSITVPTGSTVGSTHHLSASPLNPTTNTASINSTVSNDASQVVAAQNALNQMTTNTLLTATITTSRSWVSGVYSAPSLSTTDGITLTLDGQHLDNQFWVFNITDILAFGANTLIKLVDVGTNSAVIWNSGGYTSLGDSATVIGTVLAHTYVSVGANAHVSDIGNTCGAVFSATSYVESGDTSVIGGNGCSGLGDSFKIDPMGKAYYDTAANPTPPPTAVAEPASWMLMATGLLFTGLVMPRRTRRNKLAA